MYDMSIIYDDLNTIFQLRLVKNRDTLLHPTDVFVFEKLNGGINVYFIQKLHKNIKKYVFSGIQCDWFTLFDIVH